MLGRRLLSSVAFVAPRLVGLSLVAVCVTHCEDEGDGDEANLGGSGGSAMPSGSMLPGSAGSGMAGRGGSAGSVSSGNGGQAAMPDAGAGANGGASMMGPAPGETGVFMGLTAAHNAVRADLDLPPLTWSPALAEVAQDWADTLTGECGTLRHRMPNMYGENIAARGTSGNGPSMTGAEAVIEWEKEIDCWTFGAFMRTDSCDTSCTDALNASGCGHYTQLVWRGTTQVGCGYATCRDGQFDVDIWVCNYSPPGNVIGRNPY